jgi:hypothetical protein
VTTPDPTDNTYAPVTAQASKKGKKQKSIVPEATKPLPGQNDPSKPQVVLPPAVQQLLNQLPQVKLDPQQLQNLTNVDPSKITNSVTGASAQPTDNKSADKLLDFLMAP